MLILKTNSQKGERRMSGEVEEQNRRSNGVVGEGVNA
jgi:hypothetical protein